MELRHLRYFRQVARELSFTKAAQTLRVAQPALSRQIRQLEEEIGAALFERSKKQVSLTVSGRAFLAEADAILSRTELAVGAARSAVYEGTLNLGYIWGLFHTIAPAALAAFRHRHPRIAVNLFDLSAIEQAQRIGAGKLDGGFIGFADEADAAGLSKKQIGVSTFMAALPQAHPATRKRTVDLASLAGDFFLLISEQTYPGAARLIQQACQKAGFRPKILQAAERGHTMLSLVGGECGVALAPAALRDLPHPGVTFRPLKDPIRAPLYFAWRGRAPCPGLETFVAELALSGQER